MNLFETIIAEAEKHGDKLAALSVARLGDIKADFERLGIDTTPYFTFTPPPDLGFTATSVLIVASPCPPAYIAVCSYGEEKKIAIPPTYVGLFDSHNTIKDYLAAVLSENGHAIATARGLPCKPIAAHAGLGTYGRNNVIYVEGMGSFLRLETYYSDIPCDDIFQPLERLGGCDDCRQCITSCPTGALCEDSEVVDADRCLCWLNEHDGEFPTWVRPEWHNALIGCVMCQYDCPRNREFLKLEKEIAAFDEEHTKVLLTDGDSVDIYEQLGLSWFTQIYPRNLRALLRR